MICIRCTNEQLDVVTIQEFKQFVDETAYVTDAEKFGWTFIQNDVDHFEVVEDITWKNAYQDNVLIEHFPVTQVSYNDAKAYSDWSGYTIPTYTEYWKLVKRQNGIINSNSTSILPNNQCHIIGNVWEITTPDSNGQIRLAGGSYLCNEDSCNGTSPNRILYVDATTGNSHIGFAVIKK